MTDAPDTFEALIERWGIANFAADLGVNYSTANAMKQRKSVPARYWPALIEKGASRGIPVGTDDLLAMERRKERRPSARASQQASAA